MINKTFQHFVEAWGSLRSSTTTVWQLDNHKAEYVITIKGFCSLRSHYCPAGPVSWQIMWFCPCAVHGALWAALSDGLLVTQKFCPCRVKPVRSHLCGSIMSNRGWVGGQVIHFHSINKLNILLSCTSWSHVLASATAASLGSGDQFQQ